MDDLNNNVQYDEHFLEHYSIDEPIGGGGLGIILAAKDIRLGREVAVKSLRRRYLYRRLISQEFVAEARLNAILEHPYVVPVYDLGRSQGIYYIAMKRVRGRSLREILNDEREKYRQNSKGFPDENAELRRRLHFFASLCDVVSYCHQKGIVHGDIKPENIMLGSHGELYLLDWGCARKAGEHWKAVQGTPRYLPPEAYKTRVVDPKTDIFALGVILYEIFTLRKGGCRHASDKKLAGIEDVHALTSYRHFQNGVALDRRFTAIVRKAVDVDVARRYADVASLQSDVRRFMMGESISATHFSISELFGRFLFRNPFVIVLFVLSFLACMMGMRVYYQFQVVDAENSASAELLQLSELQSDISVLATHVDMNYLQSRFRLSLMSSALFEVLRTHPGELLEQYSNEDYREGESSTVDVQYFPGFREPVSMTHAVRHGALPKRQKVKFCEQCFAKIAKNVIFSEEEQIDQSEFLTETGFERIFFENQDGTRYSYPGRYENEEAENYRNRWQTYSDVAKGNPGTMVFQENGIWLATFSAPILDENARHKGWVSAEFRLDFLYRDVVEESKKWPDRKFYIIGSPFDKILIQDGNILRGTSDGGCSEAVLSAQMQEVKQDRFAVKTFTDAGVHWALSGAPIEHVGGHMLFQLVSLGKADVHPQGTQNE